MVEKRSEPRDKRDRGRNEKKEIRRKDGRRWSDTGERGEEKKDGTIGEGGGGFKKERSASIGSVKVMEEYMKRRREGEEEEKDKEKRLEIFRRSRLTERSPAKSKEKNEEMKEKTDENDSGDERRKKGRMERMERAVQGNKGRNQEGKGKDEKKEERWMRETEEWKEDMKRIKKELKGMKLQEEKKKWRKI